MCLIRLCTYLSKESGEAHLTVHRCGGFENQPVAKPVGPKLQLSDTPSASKARPIKSVTGETIDQSKVSPVKPSTNQKCQVVGVKSPGIHWIHNPIFRTRAQRMNARTMFRFRSMIRRTFPSVRFPAAQVEALKSHHHGFSSHKILASGITTVLLTATSITTTLSCESKEPDDSYVYGETLETRPMEDILYPEIEPYARGFLQVSPVHRLAYEECGNPHGKPVLLVHGGPGGGCGPDMRRFHDPATYRMILVDQRGAGRSTPHACLTDNTTWDLVADFEVLRKHLGVNEWQVFGGSWGSTLAIVYAETYPEVVTELVLRGIFHLRKKELAFYYQEGANFLYPDKWASYRDAIPEPERHDFIQAYHTRLTSPDPAIRYVGDGIE